jgi:single-strand DNA-binding protein
MNTLKNSVHLIGNLGKDVEIKELASGGKRAKIILATNDYYKNNKGEAVTETQWHNLVAWGKTAELMASLLTKGSEVVIQGKLMHRSYEDKDGITRYTSEVKVNEFMKVSRQEKETAPF